MELLLERAGEGVGDVSPCATKKVDSFNGRLQFKPDLMELRLQEAKD